VKHIHHGGFTIDTEGKDTWKHARAGAKIVIASSPDELAVIKKMPHEAKFEEISRVLHSENLDVVFLEGFSKATAQRGGVYKIVAAKDVRDLKHTLAKTHAPILAITGPVTEKQSIPNSHTPLLNIQKEGPVITSILRRLLRPHEIERQFTRAARRHGSRCIGLAIGVRATHLASSTFGANPSPDMISCGTKHCIAEAFRMIYPRSRVREHENPKDQVLVRSRRGLLVIQLAGKKEFSSVRQVLKAPDEVLFDSVSFTPR